MRGQKLMGIAMVAAVIPWAMAFWSQASPANDIPAYHRNAPTGALANTLPPSEFTDPRVQAAYAMAAQVKPVLYQQPCYCHCDKELAHHSLLDCFTGDHASICATCLMEGVYTYQQTKAGKTPGEIRAAIERGEWKNVDLNKLLVKSR